MIARRNPSRMQRIEDELVFDPAWLGDSWEAFVARLQAQAWRGQIIGPHGSGNSACLRRLEHHLRDHGMHPRFVLFNEDAYRPTTEWLSEIVAATNPNDILLIDGAEQLGRLQGWSWFRELSNARMAHPHAQAGDVSDVGSIHPTPGPRRAGRLRRHLQASSRESARSVVEAL
ncbi:MAG: hypothetical protein ACKVHP_12690 [Verrucomicrobiales bacterium]|jgi:hypothetical protein